MSGGENCIQRPLFGGAISSTFPVRFQDVSNIHDVPDHQEVFVDPARDESLIFELLDLKGEVEDGGSALWFLRDITNKQDAGDNMVVEHSGTLELTGLRIGEAPAVAGTAIGQLAVSKGRQGREAQNIVQLYLANIRLKNAATDVVITGYEALLIKEKVLLVFGSESCCPTARVSRGAASTPATLSPSLGPDSGVPPLLISYPLNGSGVEFVPPGPSDTC